MPLTIHKSTTLSGHKGPIYAMCEGKARSQLYSCSNDLLIVQWDLTKPQEPIAICKLPSKAFSFAYAKAHNHLLIGTFKGMLRIVDLNEKKEIKCIALSLGIIYRIYIDESANRFLVLTEKGVVNVFELDTYALVKQVKISDKKIRGFYHDLELDCYYIGDGEGRISTVERKNITLLSSLNTHQKGFGVNAILKVGNTLLSGSRDAHLMGRKTEAKNISLKIPAHNYAIYDLVMSPNKDYFATCSMDKTIKIWDASSMELIERIDHKTYQGHARSVNCLIWNEQGLISGSDDGKIYVWRVETT